MNDTMNETRDETMHEAPHEGAPTPSTPTPSTPTFGTHKLSTNAKRLERRLKRQVAEMITHYGMIEAGDRVMVCLSGGKDSYTLLELLLNLQRRAPIPFEVFAMHLDQKQPGYPETVLPEYLRHRGVPFVIVEQNTYGVVKAKVPEGKTMCSLCSRLRRGVIYRVAKEHRASKIALGHHRDDILATFFLNLFYGGRLEAMPPKLRSDDGAHVLIRPLASCAERDIARYARARRFPIIPCTLCGQQADLKRQAIERMLSSWEKSDPTRIASIFRALSHVSPSHLLDDDLFDFAALRAEAEGA